MLAKKKKTEFQISKISAKGQVTIPQSIRDLLALNTGDSLAYIVENNQVTLKKAEPLDIEFLRALEGTLSEWNSDEDNNAYNNL